MATVLGVTFLWACFAKALAISDFGTVIGYLIGLPDRWQWLRLPFASIVVGCEAYLGAALLCHPRSRGALPAALVTLSLFSVALLYLWWHPAPRGCGCLGFASSAMGARQDAALGLLRNAFLMLMTICCMLLSKVTSPSEASANGPATFAPDQAPASSRAGFTLIELMVCCLVVAVLVALISGGLFAAHRQARFTKSLSTHQQLVGACALYTQDNKEFFPYIGTPGAPDGPQLVSGYDLRSRSGGPYGIFRANTRYWTSLLFPAYWDSRSSIEPEWSRHDTEASGFPDGVVGTNYFLAHACAASHDFWTDPMRPDDTTFLRGATVGSVTYPSSKGLILDVSLDVMRRSPGDSNTATTSTARVDGSAASIAYDPSRTGGDGVVSRPYGAIGFPVLSTRYGMAGRDF